MAKTKAGSSEVIAKFARKKGDTGSPEVQIALMSGRIKELTEHLKSHKKDFSTTRGLLALVSKRRKLLTYLNKKDHARYLSLTKELEIRK